MAVGEAGLDFNRNFSPPAAQERWFAAQVELAEELGLPLFMHCRDAGPRFAEILRYRCGGAHGRPGARRGIGGWWHLARWPAGGAQEHRAGEAAVRQGVCACGMASPEGGA